MGILYGMNQERLTKQEVVDAYRDLSGLSHETLVSRMASRLSREEREIRAALDKYDFEYENVRRKYEIDHHFFHPDAESPDQFYWAGFIAANGEITTQVGLRPAYRLEISLSYDDYDQLEKLVNMFHGTMPVKVLVRQPNNYRFCRVVISSKYMVNDLRRFNIVPKKKTTYQMPDWLITHRFIRDFLRGWVDGLGGFYQTEDGKTFNTRGTREFVIQMRSILRRLGLADPEPSLYDQNSLVSIRYRHQADVKKIAEYLYNDCSAFMERKKVAALES